ncbi:AMP-binding protein [Paraglaciecola sp. MB-3u-78]|uniref:AMP-binding protein n=1 Tax=Paraglaciecola sp. MB-3u-78 TaxID=2058332 RepID=UPI000C32272C|nr:AMP-binding protein [Paraglaciecola sp. MB-3u-78]PKH00840.1 long-chain fatty acid--CoA ligase [Paraglaciecola sp. MB-3u-78]
MQSFSNQLANLPTTGVITSAGEHSSIAELIKQAQEIRLQYPQLCQHSIAISYTNLNEFIAALIAFDGWCSAIYVCPPDVSISDEELIKWPLDNAIAVIDSTEEPPKSTASDVTQTTWYLATSGTTGEPKWFSHSFLSLTANTKYSHRLQTLCWALLYQPFRFAGLQVVLQALLSGADLVDVVDYEPLVQMAFLKHGGVTAVSATPSLWRQLLMTGQLSELTLSHITLGGEIADQSLLDKLQRLFPKAKLRHIYASTEAGVGFVVTDGLAGFPAKWLDDCSLSVALKVSDKQHLLIKPSHHLCQTLAQQTDAQGYVDTLDTVKIIDDRVFFLGRSTGTINVGGNKVHPEKVEQVLLQCADISQVKVYAKKSALLGELVVADVTIDGPSIREETNQQEVKQQLLKLCKNQLQRFEIPTKINIVNNISYDPSGKLNRKQHD